MSIPAVVPDLRWHRVLAAADLPDGRVTTVVAGHRSIALTHVEGRWGALDNRCPHQGGPLGEGSIEKGQLRCPWHGYDYCPIDGGSAFGDGVGSHAVEVRDDGFVWVGVPRETPRVRTASDVLAETLVAYGVRDVFGMVGHSNLGMADALREREEAGDLRFVGIRHEGAAAFAASAYGKLTGRPAACLTIAGPGATNLLTGLWDAHLDGAPVVALTGQVESAVRGLGAFQDVDLAAAFGGVAAWTAELGGAGARAAELAAQAVRHAVQRRGVSHLVLPDEAQVAASAEPAGSPSGRLAAPSGVPSAAALDAAVAVLRDARRPVIIAGHGARAGRDAVRALAEHLGAPIVTTFKAKGLVGDEHPLAGGVLGRSGTPVASWVMNEADALLVLGASFANHTGIYAGHPIVHVDDRLERLGDRHAVAAPVHGDVGVVCGLLRDALPGYAGRDDQAADLRERWAIWHAEKASRARDDRGRGVAAAAVFAALSALAPRDAVLCVDVGNHAYSFGRYFESRAGQDVLMSGYLGSIGFALPAALGASAATRGSGRRVIAVCGDGGFGQYAMELTTAVRHRMPITVVLLDNGQLGKISKEQRAGEWDVWQTSLTNPDFAAFAALCGAHGEGVDAASGLAGALGRALAADGPSLVAVRSDPELV